MLLLRRHRTSLTEFRCCGQRRRQINCLFNIIQVPRGVRGAVGSPRLTYGAINHTPRRRRMARVRAAHAGPARVRRALRELRRSQRARSNGLRVSQKVMVLAPEQAGTRCGARETSPGAPRRQRCVSGVFSIKPNVPPRTLMAAYS